MNTSDEAQEPPIEGNGFRCVGGPLDGQTTDARGEEFYEALLPMDRPEPHTSTDLGAQARVHVYRFDRAARVYRWQGER